MQHQVLVHKNCGGVVVRLMIHGREMLQCPHHFIQLVESECEYAWVEFVDHTPIGIFSYEESNAPAHPS